MMLSGVSLRYKTLSTDFDIIEHICARLLRYINRQVNANKMMNDGSGWLVLLWKDYKRAFGEAFVFGIIICKGIFYVM